MESNTRRGEIANTSTNPATLPAFGDSTNKDVKNQNTKNYVLPHFKPKEEVSDQGNADVEESKDFGELVFKTEVDIVDVHYDESPYFVENIDESETVVKEEPDDYTELPDSVIDNPHGPESSTTLKNDVKLETGIKAEPEVDQEFPDNGSGFDVSAQSDDLCEDTSCDGDDQKRELEFVDVNSEMDPLSHDDLGLTCEESGNTQSSLLHLNDQKKLCQEKYFSCTLCNYKATSRSTLKAHSYTHSGERTFACAECSFKTNAKSSLTVHLRTHSGEKPFSCTLCSYKTTRSSSLKRHSHTHSGDKPFSCTQCSYKTITSDYLKRHLYTHTEEKPFSCTLCSYKTTRSTSLKIHSRTHAADISS